MHRGRRRLQWNKLATHEAGEHTLEAGAVDKVRRGLRTAIGTTWEVRLFAVHIENDTLMLLETEDVRREKQHTLIAT